jgi:phage-related protein
MTHIVQSSKQAFQDFGVIVNAVGDFFERLVEKIANFISKVRSAIEALKEFVRESASS